MKPYSGSKGLNPLPDDKILDWSKMKQIEDDILKWVRMEYKCRK